jgi:hypothetical protein
MSIRYRRKERGILLYLVIGAQRKILRNAKM